MLEVMNGIAMYAITLSVCVVMYIVYRGCTSGDGLHTLYGIIPIGEC